VVLILALPRTASESGLDRFFKKRETGQGADIVFIYDAGGRKAAEREDAARVCVSLYNGRSGIHASRYAFLQSKRREGMI
jgi:hypothetical protein